MKKSLFKFIYLLLATMFVFSATLSSGCTSNPPVSQRVESSLEEDYVMPTMRINTINDAKIESKDLYTSITASAQSYREEHSFDNLSASIKLRGNASLNFEKKSYKIKFSEKINLLGTGDGPAKDWVLLANHCDKTFLRNYLAYYMANKMEYLGFNAHSNFVQLYLNDEYQGVYVVSESIEVNKYRVDITVDSTVDTGWLIELDSYKDGEHVFHVRNKYYVIKSDIVNQQQADAIKKYIEDVDQAMIMKSKDKLEQLIDINSFVDYYVVEEFFKNPDIAWSSGYMWKDKGGKLHIGPVWDFDNAVGNDYRLESSSYEHLRAGYEPGLWVHEDAQNTWYKYLTRAKWFNDLIKERWVEKLDLMKETIEIADTIAEANRKEIHQNYDKWKSLQVRVNCEGAFIFDMPVYQQHVDHLQEWLYNRIDWLNEYWKLDIKD